MSSVSQKANRDRRGPARRISLLVTDLDNTLWDWVHIWHSSFQPLLREIVRISGVPQDELEDQIRTVHQARGTSEYAYLLQEIPALQQRYPDSDLSKVFDAAIHAYRSGRLRSMRLYPGVLRTLERVRTSGASVVGYTESLAYYSAYRIRKLGLDGMLNALYSPPDHDFPAGVSADDLRHHKTGPYELLHTKHEHTPRGLLKPAPEILETIVQHWAAGDTEGAAYVGDSLTKDVLMAQQVGVTDVYAAYGDHRRSTEYELLRRVSHWTQADVERERRTMTKPDITPSYRIGTFDDLLHIFEFGPR